MDNSRYREIYDRYNTRLIRLNRLRGLMRVFHLIMWAAFFAWLLYMAYASVSPFLFGRAMESQNTLLMFAVVMVPMMFAIRLLIQFSSKFGRQRIEVVTELLRELVPELKFDAGGNQDFRRRYKLLKSSGLFDEIGGPSSVFSFGRLHGERGDVKIDVWDIGIIGRKNLARVFREIPIINLIYFALRPPERGAMDYRGLFAGLAFNKELREKTIVAPRTVDAKVQQFLGNFDGLAPTETDDPAFNEMFQVYSSATQESFYVLSSATMERILNIQRKASFPLFFSFTGDRVYVSASLPDGGFTFPGKIDRPEVIELFEIQTCLILDLTDELRLNDKIWKV